MAAWRCLARAAAAATAAFAHPRRQQARGSSRAAGLHLLSEAAGHRVVLGQDGGGDAAVDGAHLLAVGVQVGLAPVLQGGTSSKCQLWYLDMLCVCEAAQPSASSSKQQGTGSRAKAAAAASGGSRVPAGCQHQHLHQQGQPRAASTSTCTSTSTSSRASGGGGNFHDVPL